MILAEFKRHQFLVHFTVAQNPLPGHGVINSLLKPVFDYLYNLVWYCTGWTQVTTCDTKTKAKF